ncbi:MAG TPA: glycerate kinase [Candidatus Saccharimonadales bacterium]|nr:glycerate kinase [Candidatus Saccharimonadales bacterium]
MTCERPLTVLIAPDSFKGSLSSIEVASALAAGWERVRPNDRVLLAPLADGGEGTLEVIEATGGWVRREADAHDPLGLPVCGWWLESPDGRQAVMELAITSGLSLVPRERRDALSASTLGTGEVLRAALDTGVRRITLGLGGSATTDGGSGILCALGARLLDERDQPIGPGGAELERLARADLSGLDPRLGDLDLRIASDVDNPLLGPRGAAAVYGPQKGASPLDVERLDAALGRYADRLADALEPGGHGHVDRERARAGAGAAGGTTFGLAAISSRLRSFDIVPGIDVVIEETDLDARLRSADLVLTGEGRIDEQTGYGKTALGIARRARAAGLPCVAIGGGVAAAGIDALRPLGAVVVPVVETPMTVHEAMALGRGPVERCGERIAALVSIGLSIGRAPR